MTTAWFSLKRRLLGLLLGGVAIAWIITVVFGYLDAHHEVDELFDAQLAQSAQTLLALASHESGHGTEALGNIAHKYQRSLHFQIWRSDGQLVMRSDTAPAAPLTAIDGFSEVEDHNGHWRYFSQWNAAHSLQVQVGEDHRIRDELIGHIAWRLSLPALFGLPLIGLWVWLATRRGLASLNDIARHIEGHDLLQLQALEPASAPAEIRPMLDAINQLFQRIERALQSERRFTADAAHELRTPLAALQAQLQVALRARDDAERDRSLARLQVGLIRTAHLVEQMLQLARLDPESGLPDPKPVNLGTMTEEVCADLGSQILGKDLDFHLHAAPESVVSGQAEWLRVLIRNLIDNAVRYTPHGGRVSVHMAHVGACCRLIVADSGPGIPAEMRQTAMQRFRRLNTAEQPGSGLGLAIVSRIVDLHGAMLEMGTAADGGLEVSVTWKAIRDT